MKKIIVVFCAMFLIPSTAAFAKTLPGENAAKDSSAKTLAKTLPDKNAAKDSSAKTLAKTLPDENAAKDLSAKITADIAAGNLDEAFKIMKLYTSVDPAEIDNIVIQCKTSMEKHEEKDGASIGYELVDSKKIGDSLLRFRYIMKGEKHLILWEFYFYKAREGWILDSFNWNDSYRALFEK